MAIKSLEYFKERFKTKYKFTKTDYLDWLDSFQHVDNFKNIDEILVDYVKKNECFTKEQVEKFVLEKLKNYMMLSNDIPVTKINEVFALVVTKDELKDRLKNMEVSPNTITWSPDYEEGYSIGVLVKDPKNLTQLYVSLINKNTLPLSDKSGWEIKNVSCKNDIKSVQSYF